MNRIILLLGVLLATAPTKVNAQSATAQTRAAASATAALDTRTTGPSEKAANAHSHAEAGVEGRLELARQALEEGAPRREPREEEVTAGAEALAAGAAAADLTALRRRAPEGRDLTASLRVLGRLTARGHDSGRAAAALATRLALGAGDGALFGLPSGPGAIPGSGLGSVTLGISATLGIVH